MAVYSYTKALVNIDTLNYEIEQSDAVGIASQIIFNAPNSLEVYFTTTLSGSEVTALNNIVALHDGQELDIYVGDLDYYVDSSAVVVDPYTSVSGTFIPMQVLVHRRDLYNDEDNPLYSESVTPILGGSGLLQQRADDISAINTALGANGWYTKRIKSWVYPSPLDLLIYYGWLNSFNYSENSWNNEKIAQDMSSYNYIVFGNGIAAPTHGDYANTQVIVPRVKALNQLAKVFGYVSINQSLVTFKSKVDEWDNLNVDGIFLDEAGYDYGTTRSGFNERVEYVHGKTYANICFANAWNLNHVLGTTNDASYPNTTYNTSLEESVLISTDWCLLESFPINTTAFSSAGGHEGKAEWASRGVDADSKRYTYGINLAAVGVINNDNVNGQELFNFGFVSSMMWNLDAFGTSDTSYASSSAIVKRWDRPRTEGLGREWAESPAVQMDNSDNDVYHRYLDFARLSLDFSTSAETADILKFTPPDSFKIRFNAGDLTEGTDPYPNKTTASGNPITGLGFDDTIEESMYDAFEIPANWMHGTDVNIKAYFFNDYSQTGTTVCRWAIDYQVYADLETLGSKTTTTLVVNKSLPNNVTADTFMKAELTMAYNDSNNPINRDETVMFRVYRDCTDSADTMSNDSILVLLVFEFDTEVI